MSSEVNSPLPEGDGYPGRSGFEFLSNGRELPLLVYYWRAVLRWKWVIAGIIAFSFVLGLIVTMLMTPLYKATASIEISRQEKNIVNVEGVDPNDRNVDLEFYQTQYGLLRARSLAERVAKELKLTETGGFFETFGVDPDNKGLFAVQDSNRVTPAMRQERMKVAIDLLLDNISIVPARGSSLVDVSFTSPNPVLSARVANAWTSGFIASNLDRRFEATAYAREFLEDRLQQLRARLEDSERQVVQYASRQRIINIPAIQNENGVGGTERSLVADELARLNGELSRATAERVEAESRLRTAPGISNEALRNAAIVSLRQKRAELAAEYESLLTKFEPGYPVAEALASQIKDLDRSISREEVRVQEGLRSRFLEAGIKERTLQAQMQTLENSALDLRRRSIQYNIYQREADTNRALYDGLLQRYKEIGVAGGVGTNNVLIVDAASSPDKPASPSMLINLLISLVLGSLIAVATIFALEQIDETIKDPSEAGRVLGAPVLGLVPAVASEDPTIVLSDRKSAIAEAYLSIQTNLGFSTDHGIPRSITVTSTKAAEGKSTTCYALAQTLARIGRKVVLIDCDMRSPSVHQLVGVENKRGVSNFLSGDDDINGLVFPIEALGVDAMAAGPQPPNAAELLTSSRLHQLIERLQETYDHVMIDSPPVLGLADAPLIGNQAEGVVYVVEANGARSSLVLAAISRLRDANVNLLGIVLTKFEAKKAHYGYGYEYGYNYGHAKSEASA